MRRAIAVAALAGLAATGCGDNLPKLTNLEGRVTFDGKPLKAGYVQFVSDDNVTSTGAELTAEGRYRLAGAPVGPVKIGVTTRQYRMMEPSEDDPASRSGTKKNPNYLPVPEKYSQPETSGLTATIEPGQKTFDLDFSSK